jgi:hypothetical protein
MGIFIVEPPLARSILSIEWPSCADSPRVRRRLMLVEEEEEEGTGGTVMPSPTLPGGTEDDAQPADLK